MPISKPTLSPGDQVEITHERLGWSPAEVVQVPTVLVRYPSGAEQRVPLHGVTFIRSAPTAPIHSDSFAFQQLVAENDRGPRHPTKRCICPGGILGWHNDCPAHGFPARADLNGATCSIQWGRQCGHYPKCVCGHADKLTADQLFGNDHGS